MTSKTTSDSYGIDNNMSVIMEAFGVRDNRLSRAIFIARLAVNFVFTANRDQWRRMFDDYKKA